MSPHKSVRFIDPPSLHCGSPDDVGATHAMTEEAHSTTFPPPRFTNLTTLRQPRHASPTTQHALPVPALCNCRNLLAPAVPLNSSHHGKKDTQTGRSACGEKDNTRELTLAHHAASSGRWSEAKGGMLQIPSFPKTRNQIQ